MITAHGRSVLLAASAILCCSVLLFAPGTASAALGIGPVINSPLGGYWYEGAVTPPHDGVGSISCVSTGFCLAVDDDGNYTTYDGSNWTVPVAFDSSGSPLGVSCVSSTFCMATDLNGNVFVYNGSTWSAADSVDPGVRLNVISCASTNFCVATDEDNAFVYDGSWGGAVQLIPTADEQTDYLLALSCAPGSSFCIATDDSGNAYLYSGSWSGASTVETGVAIVSVSCLSTTSCMAGNSEGDVLTYDGTSWSLPSSTVADSSSPLTVSCASSTLCAAAAGAYVAVFDGTSWGTPAQLPDESGLGGVTCAGTFCVASSSGLVWIYSGSSWGSSVAVDFGGATDSVSCPVGGWCMAAEPGGEIVELNGDTWQRAVEVAPGDDNADLFVSCASPSFCAAVDGAGNAFIFDGTSWSAPTAVDSNTTQSLDAVSCVSADFCAAVDGQGNAFTYNGSTWSEQAAIVPMTDHLSSVSCISADYCVALDGNASSVLVFNGTTWGSAIQDSTGRIQMSQISCATTSFCVVVGSDADGGVAVTFDGSAWSAPTVLNRNFGATTISCPETDYCIAGDNAWVYNFNGTSWGATVQLEASDSVTSLSCTSARFCVAGDSVSNAFVYLKSVTTMTVTVAAPAVRQSVQVDVQVAGPSTRSGVLPPAGRVTIRGGNSECQATLSVTDGVGTGSCSMAWPDPGSVSVQAEYAGNGLVPLSLSAVTTIVVGPQSSTTTVSLPAGLTFGHEQSEAVHVTVDPRYGGAVSGKLVVSSGAISLCTLTLTKATGMCDFAPEALLPGRHGVVATYEGDSSITKSVSAAEFVTVSRASSTATLKLSAASVRRGHEELERFDATVRPQFSGVATGHVLVVSGSRVLCTVTLSRGDGSCSPSADALPAGTYDIVARYAGSVDFAASSSRGRKLTVTK